MAKYRNRLPQMQDDLFLTDGGLETWLCFQQGIDLPEFASFPLIDTAEGRTRIVSYMEHYIRIALVERTGFILETPTWRANSDWGSKLGYDGDALYRVNVEAVGLMAELRDTYETPGTPMVISGNIGPRGDGYNPQELLTAQEAERYHAPQIRAFSRSQADLVTALTVTHPGEAIGIVRAAQAHHIPVVISFTTETDGRLPDGTSLADAINAVDNGTEKGAAYFMINCAHPTHFQSALAAGENWVARIRGIRANASTRSHEELDNSEALDEGNPAELGQQYLALRRAFPHFTVLGGCCGTDHRHVACIGRGCRRKAAA